MKDILLEMYLCGWKQGQTIATYSLHECGRGYRKGPSDLLKGKKHAWCQKPGVRGYTLRNSNIGTLLRDKYDREWRAGIALPNLTFHPPN